ncbi:MAG: FtsW/RodA/SpoVE family cell cycle protein [Oscillospiraceae bacterium]|nr:FtsW/RodA/SpoVE family cell cycle protein [Oscillospiraceae bacterium]
MRRILTHFWEAFRKGDLILLLLCVLASAFGCLIIASTTAAGTAGPTRYIIIQIAVSLVGVVLYTWVSSADMEWFSEKRRWLVGFNVVLLLLLIPFGKTVNGNRSWLDFFFLPFDIQPAELCKISFILIMASVMASHQNNLSAPKSVFHMCAHFLLIFGMNYIISGDMGVSLIFAFIFAGMVFCSGVSMVWIGSAIAFFAVVIPIAWNMMSDDNYMKTRIAVLFNPELDANGTGVRYQTVRALRSLVGGGLTGQGLFEGHRTQTNGALFAQHTDFIYSAIGEELGFVGCAAVLVLLCLIIIRCFWVGIRSQDTLRRLVCFGVASALMFQVIINVGMNIGVMPVIGLTLPFISYGGSSAITLYVMLGLVSGAYAHPTATSHERYIRPPIHTLN